MITNKLRLRTISDADGELYEFADSQARLSLQSILDKEYLSTSETQTIADKSIARSNIDACKITQINISLTLYSNVYNYTSTSLSDFSDLSLNKYTIVVDCDDKAKSCGLICTGVNSSDKSKLDFSVITPPASSTSTAVYLTILEN